VRLAVLVVLLLAALPASASADDVRFTVAASGDILIHSPIAARAKAQGGGRRYEFRPFFRAIRPVISSADLALCHAETPMGAGAPTGYPSFNAPASLADAIAATGWDACSTASNHSLDKGRRGIATTRRAFQRAGVKDTGSFLTRAQRDATTILTVKGVKVAFLAYTEMTNGIPLPQAWSVNLARAARIVADARSARRRGADVVIVNVHWGTEFDSGPSAFQRDLARRLAASKQITAVVGQHVHVVQPIRFLDGMPVVFGEGNLLSNQSPACCPAASQDGLIAFLDVVRPESGAASVQRVRYLPTRVRLSDYTVLRAQGSAFDGVVRAAGSSKRVVPIRAGG
jgi:poly-gamma-glutamate capsule biosynthesis protein CapA/YwtB (metallophosphatase superfamily)